MKKKVIFIITVVAIALIAIEVYISKNNTQNENQLENISATNSTNNDDTNSEEVNDNVTISTDETIKNGANKNESTSKTESEDKGKNNTVGGSSTKNDVASSKVSKQLSPSGFMGSSLYKVNLYSNGDVYVITYDGEGYEDKNIIDKKLIAKNVKSIEQDESEENYGGIIVKGGEAINENLGWISFSK